MARRVIRWGNCRCYVWPLDPRLPAGHCRRCGIRPGVIFEDEGQAREAFLHEHGHDPVSFEKEPWG